MKDNFVFIDIETTSLDIENADIIEIAVVWRECGSDKIKYFVTLIKPRMPVPQEISNLTGITNRSLKYEKEFNEFAQLLYQMLEGKILIGHKIDFDYEILRNHFQRVGINYSSKTVCTLRLARSFIPGLKSYSLVDLNNFFNLDYGRAHRALNDAIAAYNLYEKIKDTYYPRSSSISKYIPNHEKLIAEAPDCPGIIHFTTIENEVVSVPTLNLNKYLRKKLSLSLKNKEFLSKLLNTKLEINYSLIKTFIDHSKKDENYNWSLYIVKDKTGKQLLRVGKYHKHKPAQMYFKRKSDGLKVVHKINHHLKAIFNEITSKEIVIKYNHEFDIKLKSFRPNYALICYTSYDHNSDLYQHIFISSGRYIKIIKNKNKLPYPPSRKGFTLMPPKTIAAYHYAHNLLKESNYSGETFKEISLQEFAFAKIVKDNNRS